MAKKHKIIFIGTSKFAVPILENLVKDNYQILAVVTATDKPIGRKQKITPPPIKKTALKHKLEILQPKKIADCELRVKDYNPDLIIVAAYGQIIPKNILEIAQLGSLNIHPSLLPKYRGPSPIQTAILNGEKTTGITLMLMDEKMDHGPIIAQKQTPIAPSDTYQTLEEKLALAGADLLIETLSQYLQGKIKPKPQDESQASYTKILTRQDGQINWQKSALEIERKVRAYYPWPGTWTELDGLRVKILKARVVAKEQPAALPTSQGYLFLELVQPAGKKPMTGQEFFRGHRK